MYSQALTSKKLPLNGGFVSQKRMFSRPSLPVKKQRALFLCQRTVPTIPISPHCVQQNYQFTIYSQHSCEVAGRVPPRGVDQVAIWYWWAALSCRGRPTRYYSNPPLILPTTPTRRVAHSPTAA